jgi:hypothetical protein
VRRERSYSIEQACPYKTAGINLREVDCGVQQGKAGVTRLGIDGIQCYKKRKEKKKKKKKTLTRWKIKLALSR